MEETKTWFGEVVSEEVQAITDVVRILECIRDIEEMLHHLIASLSHGANTLKEILSDWDEIAKSDLDAMVTCDIFQSFEMFYKFHTLMGYKEETLRKLVIKLQAILVDCQAIEIGIMCDLE